jgi:hypothetical protein
MQARGSAIAGGKPERVSKAPRRFSGGEVVYELTSSGGARALSERDQGATAENVGRARRANIYLDLARLGSRRGNRPLDSPRGSPDVGMRD